MTKDNELIVNINTSDKIRTIAKYSNNFESNKTPFSYGFFLSKWYVKKYSQYQLGSISLENRCQFFKAKFWIIKLDY